MLQFLGERRGWLVAVLVVLLLLAGVAAWGFPGASARASGLIRDRLGLETEIDRVRWSFGGLELAGVTMRGRYGGIEARIDRVEAQMNPFVALFEGARAIRTVSLQGAEVTIDLRVEGLADSLALLREKMGSGSPAAKHATQASPSSRAGRAYQITDLTVRVVDADGPLMLLRDLRIQKEAQELDGTVEETLIGTTDADHARIGPTTLGLRRAEGRWQLRRLAVPQATARSVRGADGPSKALALRMREAVAVLRSAPQESPNPGPAQSPTSPPSIATSSAPERFFAHLSPDADIDVSGVQIETRTSADRVEHLRDFELRIQGDDRGSFRITVGGQTTRKGTVQVDLTATPADARAEGSLALRRISLAFVAPFVPDLPLYDPEAGTLDAELDLVAESGDRVSLAGGFALRELSLASERIAPEPVEHINLDLRGRGAWHPRERRLVIEQGQVRSGRAQLLLEGALERTRDHYRVELAAKVPPTDCNDVVSAIPKDVLGSLSEFEWSGSWSALAKVSLDSRDLDATELSIRVRNLCAFVRTPSWVRVERFRAPFRHRVVGPDGETFEMRSGPGAQSWVALTEVSPFVAPAVISHEDGAFYDHGGFAPWAIRDALVRNLKEGAYVVGASTISMQLAKNLYLEREKTIARKVQEVILTWWLEDSLDKDEILELYLNVIEYGPGVYGLRYAAAYYFGREPSELSPAESAFLACILPSPARYHVSYERGALTGSMKSRMRRLLEHMAKRGRIGPEALAYGLAELDGLRFYRMGDPAPAPRALPPLGVAEEPNAEAPDPFEALFVSPREAP